MRLTPREIKEDSLVLNSPTFVFYLPFIFPYLPLSPYLHLVFLRPVGLYHGAAAVMPNDKSHAVQDTPWSIPTGKQALSPYHINHYIYECVRARMIFLYLKGLCLGFYLYLCDKISGVSAIQASLIAFGLHYLCKVMTQTCGHTKVCASRKQTTPETSFSLT